ncbi:MAG: ATP synthase F1 subunit gamma [Planctomycetota bacterium]
MKGVRELKARLGSVSNIKKVTSTMELVATAKMKKLQERANASRPYAEAIRAMLAQVAGFVSPEVSPLLRDPGKVERECVVVIAGDKGLCGAFNTNVFRVALNYIAARKNEGVEVSVYAIGKRTEKFANKIGFAIEGMIEEKVELISHRRIEVTMRALGDSFVADKFQKISLVYTKMKSAAVFTPLVEPLLPLAASEPSGDGHSEAKAGIELDFTMEPSAEEIMTRLIPKTLAVNLMNGVHQSLASEFAARRIAMKNATDAATDMIDELRMEYNKARQTGITAELLEIISGAEALKG